MGSRLVETAARIEANPFIPVTPTPPQLLFASLDNREALYGGAAGGGKSEALLMDVAQYVDRPGYAGLLMRKTYQDLALPGALMDRAAQWWAPTAAKWNGSEKIWTFPSGATVGFGYLQNPLDHLRYQGAEFQYVGFDEITQLQEHQVRYVGLSRVRRKAGVDVPLRTRGATNPGGPGHLWVKGRYVDPGSSTRPFIPARIQDNPYLDQETYIEGLKDLHPTVREQLLNGDWDVRDPGDYFRREWFGPLLDEPVDAQFKVGIRWWDLAASEKQTDEKGQRARTAGVRVVKTVWGWFCVEHAVAFWKTPGARDDVIEQTAQSDGHATAVGIEQEPGSGGIAQAETIAKRLRAKGFRVVIEPATARKEERADPVAAELERGFSNGWEGCGVRCVAGPWTGEYLDEVEGFPEYDLKDLADATASGFNWLRYKAGALGPASAEPETVLVARGEHYDEDPDDVPVVTLQRSREWRRGLGLARRSGRRRY